ncbi:MAG: glycosyltransferase family 39 protein, partial [Nevskia sp.]|nr:glycosyltransferase family 39 protein [Nevskia sp.]
MLNRALARLERLSPQAEWVLLAVLFAAALALRLVAIDRSGLWFAEAQMAWRAQGLGTALLQPGDATPPLYPLLAWLCSRVLGPYEYPLRLPSALAAAALPPAAYLVVARAWGRRLGLLAGLLALLSPISLYHAQEALPQALGTLAALLQFAACWGLLTGQAGAGPGRLALASLLLALAHPGALELLLAEAVLAVPVLRAGGGRRAAGPFYAALGGAAALAVLLLLPFAMEAARLPAALHRQPWPLAPGEAVPVSSLLPLEATVMQFLAAPLLGTIVMAIGPSAFGLAAVLSGSAVLGLALGLAPAAPAALWAWAVLLGLAAGLGLHLVFPLAMLAYHGVLLEGLLLVALALALA